MYICTEKGEQRCLCHVRIALTIGDSRCTQSVPRHLNPFVSVYRIYIYELPVSRALYFILVLLYVKKHTNTFAIFNFIHGYILKRDTNLHDVRLFRDYLLHKSILLFFQEILTSRTNEIYLRIVLDLVVTRYESGGKCKLVFKAKKCNLFLTTRYEQYEGLCRRFLF